MRTSYDVTIIGAGLAGLQCARLLARQGVSVLLVDRKNTLDQKIHTTGIFVRRTLVDFDIPDDCLGPAIKQVKLYSPALRSLELVSQYDEFRVGRMGKLYERYLQQCLHAGVHWLPQTSYLSHSADNGKLTLRLNTSHSNLNDANSNLNDSHSHLNDSHSHRASARCAPRPSTLNRFNGFASSGSTTRSITTRYLIGGDGARSRVARDLNLEQNREWIVGVESVFQGAVLEGPPQLLCFLDPKLAPGYIAWIAHDGEETHLGVGGYPSLFEPMAALQDFRSRVADIIDLRNAKQIEARAGFIPVGGVLRNIANSTGLLIGDAAGAVSPLTAGGLDPCMRLSAFAASVVTEYLSSGDVEVLQAYSGELFRSRFASRLWARRIAATFRQPQLLELGCAMLHLPLFSRLAHHVFFGRGSFPDVTDNLQPRLSTYSS